MSVTINDHSPREYGLSSQQLNAVVREARELAASSGDGSYQIVAVKGVQVVIRGGRLTQINDLPY